MKKKMHKDLFRIGSKNVDIHNLDWLESVSLAIVGFLSLTVGTVLSYNII